MLRKLWVGPRTQSHMLCVQDFLVEGGSSTGMPADATKQRVSASLGFTRPSKTQRAKQLDVADAFLWLVRKVPKNRARLSRYHGIRI